MHERQIYKLSKPEFGIKSSSSTPYLGQLSKNKVLSEYLIEMR